MIETLSAAHESGYLHGLAAGVILGMISGALLAAAGASFLIAASQEPPAPNRTANLCPPLRVVRGGQR